MFKQPMDTLKQCTHLTYHQFKLENPIGSGFVVLNMGNWLKGIRLGEDGGVRSELIDSKVRDTGTFE